MQEADGNPTTLTFDRIRSDIFAQVCSPSEGFLIVDHVPNDDTAPSPDGRDCVFAQRAQVGEAHLRDDLAVRVER